MDIANYLSELLGRHGEISVPGLGYFVHVRVSAHYNDAERKFYPPGYKIQFDPQSVEGDEKLTQYIAEKKKISLASSKYFTDKYITSLKQEVSLQEVNFADLGWFFMDKGRIAFKSKISNTDNALFYGYEPISIKKLNQTAEPEVQPQAPAPVLASATPVSIADSAPAVVAEPLPLPPPIREIRVPAQTVEQPQEYIDEEPAQKRGVSIWIIVLIILIALSAAGFGVYKYKPQWLQLSKGEEMQLPPQPKASPVIKPDTDSLKTVAKPADSVKAISKPDSALKKAVPVADTVATPTFVIFVGSFKTQSKSAEFLKDLKAKGVDARILSGPGTGRRIKVVVGSFATSAEAEAERHKLIDSKKIDKDSYSQQITNPKK
ncbi:SPOR domain-containing protein [Mucilaginibacter sp. FT3.2]|uniref:HU domain-containing protein n=1 Tax=Mucilaginibacter sp. FT3.2 TaxID=2723090 RepID=UPI0016216FD7|nr:SPOR domain-containing protein [Mucilaginibacter sp. FT3.2]MBB6231678.1 flagellar basal body-associated protein FliL [Mucilaginibacter sp. FT3.2]